MNVLYIIGNGLDISLGMKTDYQSFYDFYKTVESNDPDIEQLQTSIEIGRYKTWADLEAGLGEYSKSLSSEDTLLKCLSHLKQALESFLKDQFKNRQYTTKEQFLNDFYSPERYLDSQILDRYELFVNMFSPGYRTVSPRIVTLNYTNTLENIFTSLGAGSMEILHLHGSLETGIALGVNDPSQIANESFRKSRNIIEDFVKPSFNDACLNKNNALFEKWINEADLIVLYGTSLGVTDRRWWELIGRQLLEEKKKLMVFYFAYDEKKDVLRHPNYRLRWTEEYQHELVTKFVIPEDKVELALSTICVGINKPIFHLQMKPSAVVLPPRAR